MAIWAPGYAASPPGESQQILPSNSIAPPAIRPGGSGIKRMMDRAVTLLPHPDSPPNKQFLRMQIEAELIDGRNDPSGMRNSVVSSVIFKISLVGSFIAQFRILFAALAIAATLDLKYLSIHRRKD